MNNNYTPESDYNQPFSLNPTLKEHSLENFVAQTFDCETSEEVEAIIEGWVESD